MTSINTFSVTVEKPNGTVCISFYDGNKHYKGKVAHRKYIKWLLDNNLAKVV